MKNKYFIALSGMILQLSIGSIYAYSMWILPLQEQLGWKAETLKYAFSLAIATLGLSAAFLGKRVKEMGPSKSGILAAIFYGVGMIVAGISVQNQSIFGFMMGYGLISGIGLGLGYITPVGTVMRWFPEKPGMASGLVVMSFALGSVIAAQLILPLAAHFGVANTFYILGVGYFLLMLLAGWYIEEPKPFENTTENKQDDLPFWKIPSFYALWLLLFLNTICGISIISKAAVLGDIWLHFSKTEIVWFVAAIGLFNGLGRLIWSTVSDKIGRWKTFMLFFLIEISAFLGLYFSQNSYLSAFYILCVISCYGGAFACIAAFVRDVYGGHLLEKFLGPILTSWAAAGIIGPLLMSMFSFSGLMMLFVGIMIVAQLVLYWLVVHLDLKKKTACSV